MKKSNRTHSTRKSKSDFPLPDHPRGAWCENVKQPNGKWKMFYVGRIEDDPDDQAALTKWLAEKDHLLAGRTASSDPTGVTVKYSSVEYARKTRRS